MNETLVTWQPSRHWREYPFEQQIIGWNRGFYDQVSDGDYLILPFDKTSTTSDMALRKGCLWLFRKSGDVEIETTTVCTGEAAYAMQHNVYLNPSSGHIEIQATNEFPFLDRAVIMKPGDPFEEFVHKAWGTMGYKLSEGGIPLSLSPSGADNAGGYPFSYITGIRNVEEYHGFLTRWLDGTEPRVASKVTRSWMTDVMDTFNDPSRYPDLIEALKKARPFMPQDIPYYDVCLRDEDERAGLIAYLK